MNNFIVNPGFQHIGLNIFKNLDHQSLMNCRNVNEEWRNILNNNPRFWLARAQKHFSKDIYYTKWIDLIKNIYEKEEEFFLIENVTLCIITMLQKPTTSKLFPKWLRRKYRKYNKFPNSIHGKV